MCRVSGTSLPGTDDQVYRRSITSILPPSSFLFAPFHHHHHHHHLWLLLRLPSPELHSFPIPSPCRVSAPVKDFLRPARPLKKLYSECQKERYRLATFLSRIEAEPGLRRMDRVHCERGRFFYTYIHVFPPSFLRHIFDASLPV